jgi:hypothetical protein
LFIEGWTDVSGKKFEAEFCYVPIIAWRIECIDEEDEDGPQFAVYPLTVNDNNLVSASMIKRPDRQV